MQQYGYSPSASAIWAVVKMAIAAGQRRISRESWRIYHRHERILEREACKVFGDMGAYGQGAMLYPSDGTPPRHLPLAEWKCFNEGEPQPQPIRREFSDKNLYVMTDSGLQVVKND